jgi:hypothetical protein
LIFPAGRQIAGLQGIRVEAADGIRTHDLLHGKRSGFLAIPAFQCQMGRFGAAEDSVGSGTIALDLGSEMVPLPESSKSGFLNT